jgi:NAD(P)-dependent dehydrogenase (short-subunit alcohol dehydrogenase family)
MRRIADPGRSDVRVSTRTARCNAGAYLPKPFTEISEDEFDFQLKVNCYGPFYEAVVGKMAERGAGE